MTNNRAWLNPASRANPPVSLSLAPSDSECGGSSPLRQVVVTGDGFGGAPNVVIYRRFTDGADLEAIQGAPSEGEVGDLIPHAYNTPRYVLLPDGKTAYAMLSPVNGTQSTLASALPEFQKFRVGKSCMVPQGKCFPGATTPQMLGSGSNWKDDWLMQTSNGSGYPDGKPDICVPTKHQANGWGCLGNTGVETIHYGAMSDSWAWDAFVTTSYWQDCDVADPLNGDALKTAHITSPTIAGAKTTGTRVVEAVNPSFAKKADETFTADNAYYDYIKAGAYTNNDTSDPTDTQMVRRWWYLAIGENSRQCILLGNAATLIDSTQTAHIKHDEWTESEVRFTPDEFERSLFSHYHIIKPNGSIHSGEL